MIWIMTERQSLCVNCIRYCRYIIILRSRVFPEGAKTREIRNPSINYIQYTKALLRNFVGINNTIIVRRADERSATPPAVLFRIFRIIYCQLFIYTCIYRYTNYFRITWVSQTTTNRETRHECVYTYQL